MQILRQEISFVDPSHQRKGIATQLLHYGLDFDKLKVRGGGISRHVMLEDAQKEGFHGVQAEATSYANQMLLTKNGYKVVARTKP